ncbi:MAG: PTS sugar transporter subunit IIA [Actinomycetota bacterium]|nr:PTS sugar transporter subunit IIA [Actinomycetota bacterium]
MTFPAVPDSAIALGAEASDWRAAVTLAGAALTASGATTSDYAHEMIRMIEEHGPYVVIAPGLALAHARPGPAVLRDGLAVVTLATPVPFGNAHNDPVRVVLALAVASPEHHLPLVAELANVFNDSDAISRLAAAGSADAVREILGAAL